MSDLHSAGCPCSSPYLNRPGERKNTTGGELGCRWVGIRSRGGRAPRSWRRPLPPNSARRYTSPRCVCIFCLHPPAVLQGGEVGRMAFVTPSTAIEATLPAWWSQPQRPSCARVRRQQHGLVNVPWPHMRPLPNAAASSSAAGGSRRRQPHNLQATVGIPVMSMLTADPDDSAVAAEGAHAAPPTRQRPTHDTATAGGDRSVEGPGE